MSARKMPRLLLWLLTVALAGCDDDATAPSRSCSSSNDPLQVGEVIVLDGTFCGLLSDQVDAEYLVVPFTANFQNSSGFTLGIHGSEISLEPVGRTTATSPTSTFHTRLRRFEARVATQGLAMATPGPGPRLAAEPTLGQVDSFWVVQAIDELDRAFDDPRPGDFQRVGATLKHIGTNTLLYQDNEAPAGGLSDAQLVEIDSLFDEKLYPLDVETFGEPSDVDGDTRVTVLLSPYVNALTPDNDTSFIAGFFLALDLFARNTRACPICEFSNEREMFYGIVADPAGDFGIDHSAESVRRTLPAVMIHELQHMISFYQRVLLRDGLPEVLWLSEALAHISEELGGDLFAAEGDLVRADDFHDQNFARATFYLEDPWRHPLTGISGSGLLEERGAGWLFLRWLGDQYGSDIYRDLTQTTDAGTTNVQNRVAALDPSRPSFFQLFGEWAVTLYTEDYQAGSPTCPTFEPPCIPNLSDRYQIPKWDLRSILRSSGSYALRPAVGDFANLQGEALVQAMAGSSPYHLLVFADGTGDLTLSLNVILGSGGLVRRLIVDAGGGLAIVRTN